MVFAANQEKNKTYTFKDIMNQEDLGDFVLAMIKDMQDHEIRNYWPLIPR